MKKNKKNPKVASLDTSSSAVSSISSNSNNNIRSKTGKRYYCAACDELKDVRYFSKTQRRSKGGQYGHRCKRCICMNKPIADKNINRQFMEEVTIADKRRKLSSHEKTDDVTKKQKVMAASSITNSGSSKSNKTNNNNNAYQHCAACDKMKDRNDFTKTQLSKGSNIQRCKHCINRKRPITNNNNKQLFEKLVKKESTFKKKEERSRDILGIGLYENLCPDVVPALTRNNTNNNRNNNDNHNLLDWNVSKKQLQFSPKKLLQFKPNIYENIDDLTGTYDILYHSYKLSPQSSYRNMSHTTMGTLTLSWDNATTAATATTSTSATNVTADTASTPSSSGGGGRRRGNNKIKQKSKILRGDVKINPKYIKTNPSLPVPFDGNFTFVQLLKDDGKKLKYHPIFKEEEEEEEDGQQNFIPMKIVNKVPFLRRKYLTYGGDNNNNNNVVLPAKIKIISKRDAIGRRGKDRDVRGARGEVIVLEEYSHNRHGDVKFQTIQEAEEINRKAHERYDDSWLCHHKSLPAPVAKIIYDYVSYKPKPILFIEEDDLRIDVSGVYDPSTGSFPAYFHVAMIARRRSF